MVFVGLILKRCLKEGMLWKTLQALGIFILYMPVSHSVTGMPLVDLHL